MRVLVQKLGRTLQGTYPALLRLGCDYDNHRRQVLGMLLKCKRSTTSSAVRVDPGKIQGFTVPVTVSNITNEYDIDTSQEKHVQTENTYSHNIFLNSQKYANTVMQPKTTYAYVVNKEALEILKQDWSSMTSAKIVSAVKKLSYNICHNNDEKIEPFKYMEAFNALNVQKLTNNDLITMMEHLVPFNSYLGKHGFYNNLCVRIDEECLKRFSKLPKEKILYLCDIIYQMTPKTSCRRYSKYIWYSIRNLGNKPHKLSSHHLVQILFFLSIYRKPPINMYELEFRLEQCMDELSINELAIATLGFFKTSTKIRSKDFLNRIIQRTVEEIDLIDSVSIGNLIKVIRYSLTLTELKIFPKLLQVLTLHEPRYTLQSLTHIAQTCAKICIYDKELMDRIIGRLNKEIKSARLKDFERFLYVFSIFNIDSNNSIYQNVIEELRTTWKTTRATEIAKFPHVFSRILGYLAIQNVYPLDMIKHILVPEYINKTCYGNHRELSREFCVLDYSLRIEVPEYDGPFLTPDTCSLLEKKYCEWSEKTSLKETRANLLFTDVLNTCQELFNTTFDISAIRALPHFTTNDIVFCINKQNKLMPSEKFLSQFESSDIKYPNKENSNDIRWIAVVIAHHGLLIRNYHAPTGPLAAKIRQLSAIGYTPIMISYISWEEFKSPREKRNYIKKLVFRNVNASKVSDTV